MRDRLARGAALARAQRIDDRRVGGGGAPGKADVMEQIIERRPDAQPNPLDHIKQQRRARGAVDGKMHFLILGEICRGIVALRGGADLGAQAVNTIKLSVSNEQRRLLRRQAFEGNPNLANFGILGAGHNRHPGRAVGTEIECALGHQAAQRLAHRHGAGAELAGEASERHRLTGLELAGDQAAADFLIDIFMQRCVAVAIQVRIRETGRRRVGGHGSTPLLPGRHHASRR